MSVVNTMLRDLDARSGERRQPKIPVRSEQPAGRPWLLMATAAIAAGAIGWHFLTPQLVPQLAATLRNDSANAVANESVAIVEASVAASVAAPPAGTVSTVSQPAAPLVAASEVAAPAAAATLVPLHASWQWSNDGFALQLDDAGDVRYGIERVDAGTLKISLTHALLALLDIPAPTPGWIDSVKLQRDVQQQTVTVSAQSRLEYEIARLDDGALVISVWRDVGSATAGNEERAETTFSEEPAAKNTAVAAKAVVAPAREYAKPRIDPSVLTPAQRDVRESAQAATLLRAGQPSQAITSLQAALQSDDAAPKSAALLVTILMSQQRLRDAQPYLDRALQQTPRDVALLKLKARMSVAQGDVAQARAVLLPLAPTKSNDAELVALAASLAQQANDFTAAAAHYLQWTRIEPGSGAAWYGLALAFDAQAASANAIAAFQHALTLISDTRLRDYANSRVTLLQQDGLQQRNLQRNDTEPAATSATVAR